MKKVSIGTRFFGKLALRGAEIFGLGLLFRLQEFVLGIPISPWTDLLRVDVLNILGLSMILMAAVCWFAGSGEGSAIRARSIATSLFIATMIAVATPAVWSTARPRFLPWPLESYLDGVHIFGRPQAWLFPVFPWLAFSFAGLATGFWMFTRRAKKWEGWSFLALFMVGGGGNWGVDDFRRFERSFAGRVRLLAYQSEFFPGAMWRAADDLGWSLHLVQVGTRAERV